MPRALESPCHGYVIVDPELWPSLLVSALGVQEIDLDVDVMNHPDNI
jgi:hypothetical protein